MIRFQLVSKFMSVAAAAIFAIGLTACAGSAQDVKDDEVQTMETAEEPVEAPEEAMDEATEETEEALDEAAEETDEAAEDMDAEDSEGDVE